MSAIQKKPRLTKRQLQAIETKKKIYDAAVQVINEKGFGNVSIEDITTRANVAKGSFYTYFKSKEDLLFDTFRQSDAVYAQAFARVQDEDFLPMVTRFVKISYTEYEKRGKGIIKAIVANYFTFPDNNFYGEDRDLLKCLNHIVTKGKLQNHLSAHVPTTQYVSLLLSTLIGAEVMWCIDDRGSCLADMVADAIEVAARGMMQMAAVPAKEIAVNA
ncbi:TetR/AcrR family transcriptional regulator [Pseudoramibacter faecis]|uniref:TetR/AcrR family transcriptional regulator n=1 Tax=Pseudoramibacter faecis TaxID=3108534 RepID=UPI002E785557|nr:TetR/AcrR family transcriptional regulator [Pseudoramibacter sp. HA2172]